jgi:hypothetical protein
MAGKRTDRMKVIITFREAGRGLQNELFFKCMYVTKCEHT